MMDTLTQVERLIELAIIQRSELRRLVEELPQLKAHLSEEIERTFEETEPQLRAELEEWTTKQTADKTAALGVALEAKIADLAKSLEVSTQARYNAIIAEREENARLAAQAEAKIAEHAASLPGAVKEIVSAELARFPRAGEIDQLRKEFAEPKSLNPRGKWVAGETYNKLDLVTINGDSYVSNIDGNTEKPSRSAGNWTLNAARGNSGGGGGITALNDLLGNPSAGDIVGSEGNNYVRKTLTAGTGITITDDPSTITIDASGAQEMLTATVKNAESVAITRGQVVYLFSATGGFPSVKLAYNTSDATSAKTFGVVSDVSIAPNGTGTITCVGVVSNLNLGAYNDGDTVYLGATPGSFTATKPYAPNHLVYVGIIERANAGNGELYVRVQNGYELDEIHDVQINSPKLAGQTLIYDATTDLWKNARLTAGVGVSISNGDSAITISADGGVNYQGTWNASTNTPTLTSSVGTKGFYYVVSVAGSTNLNGVTDWKVGDWAIFNGTAWEKVDTTDQVSSVFGRTGAVVGVSTDYSAVGITNTAIGASNPSTGAFTTLSATSNLTVSGNIGLGSAASSWGGGAKAIQGQNGSLAFYDGATDQLWLSQNAYWDGSWKYIANGFASSLQQYNGELYFYSAGSGSSGGSITLSEKLKLDASGNLTVSGTGTHSFAGPLGVTLTQNAATVSNFTNASAGASAESIVRLTNNVSTMSMGLRGSGNAAYGALQGSSGYLWYNGTTSLVIGATDAAGFIKFNTGGINETMRLFANGNLFIGASPVDGGQKLQVSGTGYFSGNVGIGATSGTGRLTVYGGQTEWGATSSLGFLGYTGGNPIVGSLGALSLLIYTNGTEAARFDSSQRATFASTVTLTGGANQGQIPTNTGILLGSATGGKGIGFLDTALVAAEAAGTIYSYNTLYAHTNGKIVFDKLAANTGQMLFYTQSGAGGGGQLALTLTSTQQVQANATTDSTSTTTGALTVAGGVGIAKKLYVGGSTITTGNYYSGGSNTGLFFTGVNDDYTYGVWRDGSNSIRVTTNNVTALTISSSQQATFNNYSFWNHGAASGFVRVGDDTSATIYRDTGDIGIYSDGGNVKLGYYSGNHIQTLNGSTGTTTFAGNISVNGTAFSWSVPAIDMSSGASTYASGNSIGLITNARYNLGSGGWLYKNTAASAMLEMSATSLVFQTAPSGTAGAVISSYTNRLNLTATAADFSGITTDSSSTTTGALIVGGGVGIAKKLYVGDALTSTGSRILKGPSSNGNTSAIPVIVEYSKSSGDTATTNASLSIDIDLGGPSNWRKGTLEVIATNQNAYSGSEGAINELIHFQFLGSAPQGPRNFNVIRTNSNGTTVTLAYSCPSGNILRVTATCNDTTVPSTVPTHEIWMSVKLISAYQITSIS